MDVHANKIQNGGQSGYSCQTGEGKEKAFLDLKVFLIRSHIPHRDVKEVGTELSNLVPSVSGCYSNGLITFAPETAAMSKSQSLLPLLW